MLTLGQTRYEILRLYNGLNPLIGLGTTDFNVILLRNGFACSDPWTITDLATRGLQGRYLLSYTPSAIGEDYLEVEYAGLTPWYVFQSTEIISAGQTSDSINNVVALTQDTGGTGSLVPQVQDPASYVLYFYDAADWLQGNTDTLQALSSTALTAQGAWVSTPLYLIKGTYYLVLRNNSGTVTIFKANLAV